MKVSRAQVVNLLRGQRWTMEESGPRGETYRRPGHPQRIFLHRRDFYSEKYTRIVLNQAGQTQVQIESFLLSCVKH